MRGQPYTQAPDCGALLYLPATFEPATQQRDVLSNKTCNGMMERSTTQCSVWVVQWPSVGESVNIRHSSWQVTN
jgi:hypothetical protein